MSDLYGPTLPPGFTAAQSEEDATTEQKASVPKLNCPQRVNVKTLAVEFTGLLYPRD